MFQDKRIAVIIPAFNEAKSLARVIHDIPNIVDDIIVVDNGSTDNTEQIAKNCGARIFQERQRGYGAACLKGLSEVDGCEVVVILDADYSDYPEQLVRLIEPIAKSEADFVIGSRILGKRDPGALSPQAYWGNRLATFLIRLFFNFKFTDMGPFRAIRSDALKSLNMQDKDFGWNAEMQIKAIKRGLKIKEVPVDYRRRIGISKISGTLSGVVKAGTKIIFTVFKYAFNKDNVGNKS